MNTVFQVSDYIILRCKSEGETDLSALKHQKLLYYVQAWHLAFYGTKAFDSDFQAWIHGPVCRDIFDFYRTKKYLYSEMGLEDILDLNVSDKLSKDLKLHIDTILESYARYSANQLEIMTHEEDPWIEARRGYLPNQRCENVIGEDSMQVYYSSRLK